MEYYDLDFFGLKRKLPIVSLTQKIKIASVSLLGDVELTKKSAEKLAEKLKQFDFDYLIGPEVKVVPLLFELSSKLGKKRFVVCRKSIKGYMVSPQIFNISNDSRTSKLVLDGVDADLIKGKKVIIVDDVVSSGKTIINLNKFLGQVGAEIVATAAVFKQGNLYPNDFLYLHNLPIFDR